ncbi:sigma factor-like helix-turn-helix DNA-binding protein [Clostridium sp.]|uniref:RNA polymerase sigma factor n=1 Tax=Clostridium sp. TaxID=1506 RepID=UPI0028FDF589|nr:sigma factor-like helix-turn-helix DNA-binding protein [Clostridium sp.]MDU2157753.1 sigma factor-like helix-turn-helix DNA-binding protein [Clostridium sp.]
MLAEDKKTVEHQFDSLCKKAMYLEAKSCKRENARRFEKTKLSSFDEPSEHIYHCHFPFDYNVILYNGKKFLFRNDDLYEAMGHLQEEKRNIILLFYFLEMTDDEIAKALKRIRRTINYKRNRALKELRNYMENLGGHYGKSTTHTI